MVLDIFEESYFALKIQNLNDNEELENEYCNLIKLQNINNINDNNYNIGKIYDKFTIKIDDNIHNCILFELLGESLDTVIDNDNLRLLDIKVIIKDLILALNTLFNSNIIHCDLKPDNILLRQKSNILENYLKEIDNLKLLEKYKLLLDANLPPDFYKLNKNKRKTIKKKVKSKIIKLLMKEELDNILKINDEYNLMDDNNVNNNKKYNVKLIDFGNSDNCLNENEETIYNRSYRPPENIINEKYNLKSDCWFIGCLLYELLTKKELFGINNVLKKNDKTDRDKRQLETMIKYLGNIPKELIFREEDYNSLFDYNGKLKNSNVKKSNLYELLKDNLNVELSDGELYIIIDFMEKILNYIPQNRPNYVDLLTHDFLINV